jgi:hypothetical protein
MFSTIVLTGEESEETADADDICKKSCPAKLLTHKARALTQFLFWAVTSPTSRNMITESSYNLSYGQEPRSSRMVRPNFLHAYLPALKMRFITHYSF